MGNLNQIIGDALATVRKVAGVSLNYSRGSSYVWLTGVAAVTNYSAIPDDMPLEYTARDFLFAADDLKLDGRAIQPQAGDLITETVGDKDYVYQVRRADGGDQLWRFCDSGLSTIRVHTTRKEVIG